MSDHNKSNNDDDNNDNNMPDHTNLSDLSPNDIAALFRAMFMNGNSEQFMNGNSEQFMNGNSEQNSEQTSEPNPSPIETVGEIDSSAATDSIVPDVEQPKQTHCGHPDCRKKIGIFDIKCKCGKFFCSSHRFGEPSEERAKKDNYSHYCTFDYQAEQRKKLEFEFNEKRKYDHRNFDNGGSGGGNVAF